MVEQKPESEGRKATLQEEITATGAEKDREIVRAVQELLDQIKEQPGGQQSTGIGAPRDAQEEHEPIVYRGATACGVERWSVKTGIDPDAHLVNQRITVPTSVLKLRTLTPPADLPARNRIRPVETTVYSEFATLIRYKIETDSDYHLVLSDELLGASVSVSERHALQRLPHPLCANLARSDLYGQRRLLDRSQPCFLRRITAYSGE